MSWRVPGEDHLAHRRGNDSEESLQVGFGRCSPEAERAEPREMLSGAQQPVRKVKRAQTLLAADSTFIPSPCGARHSGQASPRVCAG